MFVCKTLRVWYFSRKCQITYTNDVEYMFEIKEFIKYSSKKLPRQPKHYKNNSELLIYLINRMLCYMCHKKQFYYRHLAPEYSIR